MTDFSVFSRIFDLGIQGDVTAIWCSNQLSNLSNVLYTSNVLFAALSNFSNTATCSSNGTCPKWLDLSNAPTASSNTSNLGNFIKVSSGSNAGDLYYIDCTGRSELLRTDPVPAPTVPIAVAIGTQAQLDALEDKGVGSLYIVTDGQYAGDILLWDDTDGDGTGDTWTDYLIPADKAQWTVATGNTGVPAGVYVYSASTKTWTKYGETVPIVSSNVDSPSAVGGILFPKRYPASATNNSSTFILYDQVAGFGRSISHATDAGSIVAPSGQESIVRKSPFSYYQVDTPYTQLTTRRAFATDVQMNTAGTVVLDDIGNLWFKGTAAFVSAVTTGSSAITSACVIDPFFATRTIKVISYWLAFNTNNIIVYAGDGTIWVRGAQGTNGIYGDGKTVADRLWHQATVPIQNYTKVYMEANGAKCYALGANGKLYAWGQNSGNSYTTTTSPTIQALPQIISLPGTTITDFAADGNSTMLIDASGNRYGIGANTWTKLGDGTSTTRTSYLPAMPNTNNISVSKVFSMDNLGDRGYYYITTDKCAAFIGYTDGSKGITGQVGAQATLVKMGTGSYQGSVIDIRCYYNSTLIHTNQGTVFTCVNGTGSTYGEHGWGINLVAGAGIGLNTFKQVPVPSVVVSVQSSSETGVNSAQYTVLTDEGRVYQWGGTTMQLDEANIKHSHYEIPISMYRQGTPKSCTQVNFAALPGVITAIASSSATPNYNGKTHTVTFTLAYSGSIGMVSTAGWTVTGTGVTVSNIQTPLYLLNPSGTITFTATVASTTDATLAVGASKAQTYTINTGSSVTSVAAGTRVADGIASGLTVPASLDAYVAANTGVWTEITTSEYNGLVTSLASTRAGASEAGMTGAFTALGIGAITYGNIAYLPASTIAANMYPYAVSFVPAEATTAATTYKFTPKLSVAATTGYTDLGSQIVTTTVLSVRKSFVLKGANTMTTAVTNLGFYKSMNIQGYSSATTFNTGVGNTSSVSTAVTAKPSPCVQVLVSPTKKW